MDTKKCKICFIEQPLENYYTAKFNKDGRMGVCKKCRNKKRRIEKKVNVEVNFPKNMFRLYRITKTDYKLMYDLLKLLGYDSNNGDIHKQFVDKWNNETGGNMKYKQRGAGHVNAYLPDGSINPDDKKNLNHRNKKNPTD